MAQTDAEDASPYGARVFVDTNVFAYLVDHSAATKRDRARHLIEMHAGQIVVSTQVMFELYHVASRKLMVSRPNLDRLLGMISRFSMVTTDRELVQRAMRVAGDAELSIYDAAMVAAAERAECSVMFTEDAAVLAAGIQIRAVNPFATPAD